jgi:hypothetical protein
MLRITGVGEIEYMPDDVLLFIWHLGFVNAYSTWSWGIYRMIEAEVLAPEIEVGDLCGAVEIGICAQI